MKITDAMYVAAIAALATGANAQTMPATPATPATPAVLPAPAPSATAPMPSPDPASPPARGVVMNTPVLIAVDAPLTSKTSQIGDTFPIRLV